MRSRPAYTTSPLPSRALTRLPMPLNPSARRVRPTDRDVVALSLPRSLLCPHLRPPTSCLRALAEPIALVTPLLIRILNLPRPLQPRPQKSPLLSVCYNILKLCLFRGIHHPMNPLRAMATLSLCQSAQPPPKQRTGNQKTHSALWLESIAAEATGVCAALLQNLPYTPSALCRVFRLLGMIVASNTFKHRSTAE